MTSINRQQNYRAVLQPSQKGDVIDNDYTCVVSMPRHSKAFDALEKSVIMIGSTTQSRFHNEVTRAEDLAALKKNL